MSGEGGAMKRSLVVFCVALLCLALGCSYLQTNKETPRITKESLKGMLGAPTVALIDVRSPSDWDKSTDKILGAQRLDPAKFDTWADTLPKDKEIVLYCA
jgi:hypothetical protein